MLIEQDRQRHGLRAELHSGGAERIGGLQRMSPLHAAVTLRAGADVNPKAPHQRPLDRQLLLVLHDDPPQPQPPMTVRTLPGQRRLVRFIDARGGTAMRPRAIRRPRLAARAAGMLRRGAARERGGLAIDGAPRRFELLLQALIFPTEPIAFSLRAAQILAQPFDFASLLVDDPLRVTRRWISGRVIDQVVMPDRSPSDKYKLLMRSI